ncbi:MAG TPA: glycosyltransferase family 39 protein [Smithella sp.]|nr:glycosyltransferase family 39 protein [Smithella sp.]HQH16563.1 glycosyltransferase family 39 protein [Smithella sp.]
MKLRKSLANNEGPSGYPTQTDSFFGKFNVYDLLVIVVCLASFGCSWIESIVNNDYAHWAWYYVPARDLFKGAVPHADTLIPYGYLSSLIQSFSLVIFGERLLSIGIMTGLFYSFTLLLSYLVFLKFMKKSLAFVSVLLIFLIHPYIIYPAPNYFTYPFQLLALIFFLRSSQNNYDAFLAGLFLAVSILCRLSSVIAILPPFILMLGRDYFAAGESKTSMLKKTGWLTAGLLIPFVLFFSYLAAHAALDDFLHQNNMMIHVMGKVGHANTYLVFLGSVFQVLRTLASDFRGKLFTLILFVCLFIIIREVMRKLSGKNQKSAYANDTILFLCLVVIFGYLNSVHVYETFRLINGASLGVGLCVFVFYNIFVKAAKPLKYFMASLSVVLFLFLSGTLFFTRTSSAYYPWSVDFLLHSGIRNETTPVFKGKMMTKECIDFYQDVFDALEPYKDSCYILNYSWDYASFVNNSLRHIQRSPTHFSWLDDTYRQAVLIDSKKAVILVDRVMDFPGYQEIFRKQWPIEIPWVGGDYLFIYAPVQPFDDQRVLPDHGNDNHHQ